MKRIEGEWRYFDEKLGIPYPWYTSPCLEYLETLDLKGKRIWEYGVGDSTFWYFKRGANCLGVDNNAEWAKKYNAQFRIFNDEYVHAITNPIIEYDIIVIDGVWRDECTEHALNALKPGGLLIIDNYKQPSVQEHWPLTEKLIEGKEVMYFKEPEHEDWQTIIVVK